MKSFYRRVITTNPRDKCSRHEAEPAVVILLTEFDSWRCRITKMCAACYDEYKKGDDPDSESQTLEYSVINGSERELAVCLIDEPVNAADDDDMFVYNHAYNDRLIETSERVSSRVISDGADGRQHSIDLVGYARMLPNRLDVVTPLSQIRRKISLEKISQLILLDREIRAELLEHLFQQDIEQVRLKGIDYFTELANQLTRQLSRDHGRSR